MKVLLINGSPHREGNTFIALSEVARTLEAEGIGAEIVHIGTRAMQGCIACGKCAELGHKENVIIGKKIPGGTGFKDYKDLDIEIKKSHKVVTEIAEQE